MGGVESIDDVGLDSPMCGGIEAVLAGPIVDRFQLLSGSTRIRRLGFPVEIADKLANNHSGHKECRPAFDHVLKIISETDDP